MQTLNDLKEKIRDLETERSSLIDEIENLRKAAEARTAALEADVDQMREEVTTLRELLGSNSGNTAVHSVDHPVTISLRSQSTSIVRPTSVKQPLPGEQENSVVPTGIDNSVKVLSPTKPNSEVKSSIYESLLKTLTGNERKVVEILIAHGGKYSQKYIRNEADLSWLQTNRIVSRLVERRIVTLEKDGGLGQLVLTNPV